MGRTVFRNANLLDGDKPSRPETTIVVEGDRVTEVTAGNVPPRAGDTVVDLHGMTLMPGMVSGHYHAAYSMGKDKIAMNAPATQLALYALANTQKALRAGYTSLVGAGTFLDVDGRLAEAIDSGVVTGPRHRHVGLVVRRVEQALGRSARPALAPAPAEGSVVSSISGIHTAR